MPGKVLERMRAEREAEERTKAEAAIRRRVEREMVTSDVEAKLRTERIAKEAADDLTALREMAAEAGLPEASLGEVIVKGLVGDEAKQEIHRLAERRAAKRFQRLGGGGLVR